MAVINNSINNSVGASNSGATNTLTIDNSSNTASSSALQNIKVGGTSAGDAFQTFTVTGTTNWSQGIDNSVTGDPFVLAASTALGTTNVISAATTGEINYPLQPTFNAYLSANASNVTGDGTAYVVVFNAERFDVGSDFDTSTGIYTFPVEGIYVLTAVISFQEIGVAHTSLVIQFVAAGVTQEIHTINPTVVAVGGVYVYTAAIVIKAGAGNTAKVQVTVSGSTKTVDLRGNALGNVCNFSGFLLG